MPAPSQTIHVPIQAILYRQTCDEFASFCCQRCQSPLDFHQPDPESPLRLLGTCPECDCCQFISFNPEGTEAVVVMLPGHDSLRIAAISVTSLDKMAC